VNLTVPGYRVNIPFAFVNPGVFALPDGHGAILHTSDYSVVTPENPARPGEIVAIYATGLGYVPSPPPTGMPASASPLSRCGWEYRARVAGVAGETLFCGLAPGYAGLYQLNVRLPQNLASGLHDLVLERAKFSDYYRAPPVKIAVAATQTEALALKR
jgi:uncharacterized protein (TIGR03437 family)